MSTWLLMLDAGDEIVVTRTGDDVRHLLHQLSFRPEACSLTLDQYGNQGSNRLIRNDGTWEFAPAQGYLRTNRSECLQQALSGFATYMQFKLWQDNAVSDRSIPSRWLTDMLRLKKELERAPNDTQGAFNLAYAYGQLRLWHEAIQAYKHRIMMEGGSSEEAEMAHIWLVMALLETNDIGSASFWSFKLFHIYQRVEGLLILARHAVDKQNNSALCFFFADLACSSPVVATRTLYFDPRDYTLFRWNLRKFCWDHL